jgi:hypothetical protein
MARSPPQPPGNKLRAKLQSFNKSAISEFIKAVSRSGECVNVLTGSFASVSDHELHDRSASIMRLVFAT